jgi:hypothetical protein
MMVIPAVRKSVSAVLVLLALALGSASAQAQTSQGVNAANTNLVQRVPARITQAVDEHKLARLQGNVHPLARAEFDQGIVPDATPMKRMLMLLQRSPEQNAALEQLMNEQMSSGSPNFHKWLTPQQFGQQFGPADADIQAITSWLSSYGFTNVKVAAGRTVIEFSGNVGQVRNAFHTEIHRFDVNGAVRQANVADPQIPAALAPVVAGIVSLHSFPKKTDRHARLFTRTADGRIVPQFTAGSNANPNQFFIVGPADFAKIYNIPSTMTGAGVALAIIGTSDVDLNDVRSFRALFGLPAKDPIVIQNGPDPGIDPQGEEGEADLDVQLSGAVASQADIKFVVTEDTLTASGVDLGALFVIDNNAADVMSLSFGQCEANLGTGGNQFFNALWQQAAAQGISVTVSAGDPGSAGCDDFTSVTTASTGLAISGIASTPFNVAVGGTDFDDVNTQANFWNQNPGANDPVTRLSAKGYIKETTWNESCASAASVANLNTICAGALAKGIVGGSGGPSAVNGKPAFQNGLTPSDGSRDIPDVSLFASSGSNDDPTLSTKSFYLICQADALPAGSNPSCASSGAFSFFAVGGTSASSPAFAGILALIDQQQGGRQGNANFVLYRIAQTAAHLCDSSQQTLTPAATCVFYDITKGNDSVPCPGRSLNCSSNTAGSNGVLVDPAHTTTPAWTTTPGFDYATGLGSVNVQNLAAAWAVAQGTFKGSTTALSPSTAINITHGQRVAFSATVAANLPATGTPTGDVSLIAPTTVNGGVASNSLQGSPLTANLTTTLLPGGSYSVHAHYAGDTVFAPSDSNVVHVVVNKENSSLQSGIVTFSPANGAIVSANATSFAFGSPYILRFDVLNSTNTACQPLVANGVTTGCALDATGTVAITDNGSALDQGTFPVNSAGHGEDLPIQLSAGAHVVKLNYSGDVSYNAAPQVTLNLTVTKATTTAAVSASPASIISGSSVTLTAIISTQSSGVAPTGTVQFLNGSQPITGTVTLTPTDGSARSPASLKATLTTTIAALTPPSPVQPRPSLPLVRLLPVLALALALFLAGIRIRRQRRLLYAAAAFLAMASVGIAGCGGGGSSAPQSKTVTINVNYSGDSNYSSSTASSPITVR